MEFSPNSTFLFIVAALVIFLGLPLPWIRMSVIGAITYELPAATSITAGSQTGSIVSQP